MAARRATLIMGVIVLVMGCANSATSVAPQSVTAPSSSTAGPVASLPTAPAIATPTTTASVSSSVAATAPPTTSPTTPASYAALEPLSASLSYRWSGDPRDVPPLGSSTRTSLNFTTNTFSLTGTEYGGDGIMLATAGLSPQGQLELVSAADEGDCTVGDRGDYPWSLSPGATILTIQAGVDACASRAALIVGEWARIDCKIVDSGCLGDLEAGDHRSQYILPRLDPDAAYVPDLGAVTYTVPAGWSNAEDFPAEFRLTPSADYALEGDDGPTGDSYHQIFIGVAPAAIADVSTCDPATPVDSSASVSRLISFLKDEPSLNVSDSTKTTIDGRPAEWIDVQLAPSWHHTCPYSAGGAPVVDLLMQNPGGDPWEYGLRGDEHERVFFIDLGQGDLVMVNIDSTDAARFGPLVDAAMPIVESLHFK